MSDTTIQILIYLIQSVASLYLLVVLLRFLLQFAQANFYNPISQVVVKATQPVLEPLRKVMPAAKNVDFASLVFALLLQLAAIELTLLVAGGGFLPLTMATVWGLLGITSLLLNVYFYGLFAVIIVSWVMPHSHHPAVALMWQLMEPVMGPFRRLIPSMGGIDLSPILLFLLINVLRILVGNLAQSVQLFPKIVPGI